MLGIITTLSSITTQPVESRLELKASTRYIIQTDNITKLKVQGTTDSYMRYKLDRFEDRSFPETILANETNAQVQAMSDVAAASNMVLLAVYEGATSFSECTGSTTNKYFNVSDISWIEENVTSTLSMMWAQRGGWGVKKYFINANLDQIFDEVTTGTTTTTTSSTSSTSTTTAAG